MLKKKAKKKKKKEEKGVSFLLGTPMPLYSLSQILKFQAFVKIFAPNFLNPILKWVLISDGSLAGRENKLKRVVHNPGWQCHCP